MATAGTCTSLWYCPPETLVPTTRVWRDHKYTFIQVRVVCVGCEQSGVPWPHTRARGLPQPPDTHTRAHHHAHPTDPILPLLPFPKKTKKQNSSGSSSPSSRRSTRPSRRPSTRGPPSSSS